MSLLRNPDVRACALLVLLWALFFWRLLTPITSDQASFKLGDFSGQFVAFGGYQHERMAAGEVPLWNPYNNGGLPFIADPQAAVFYPPRWLTIGLSVIAGGWTYHALELEAISHVLLYSLLSYAFVRRLTMGGSASAIGAFVAAIAAAYGGFVSGYPPLQLALLEAAIWLPLAALCILEATRHERLDWRWLCAAGWALGLSWLAGHPQTSWFLTYLLVAWLAYRVYVQRLGWHSLLAGLALMGIITCGTTAVTFLPGLEYTLLTARADLGFADKGNGFPIQDILQFILPGSVSLFSPLYVGVPILILIYIAVRQRAAHSLFWIGAAIIGLLFSFGANTAFYTALYNILPGLRFFRGQERAALIVAHSLAVLAGLGIVALASAHVQARANELRRFVSIFLLAIAGLTSLLLVGWLGDVGSGFGEHVGTAVFSTLALGVAIWLIQRQIAQARHLWLILLAALITFELFSVNMDADSNYDDRPPAQQLSMSAPPLVQQVLDHSDEQPFRVDGFRGLEANYGSLYGVMDIRGISPLFLTTPRDIIYQDYIHNPLAWELFAVRYVFSERESFTTPTALVGEGADTSGPLYLHALADARPFAHLVYNVDVVDSDEFALALLRDPRYMPRESIIVRAPFTFALPDEPSTDNTAIVTSFAPEHISVQVSTSTNAMLSLAMVDYPGWQATINGDPIAIHRAYGALMALAIPAGEHEIELIYNPLSYRVGAILSLVTWSGLLILAVYLIVQQRQK